MDSNNLKHDDVPEEVADSHDGEPHVDRQSRWGRVIWSVVLLVALVGVGVWVVKSITDEDPAASDALSDQVSTSSEAIEWAPISDESVREQFDFDSASFYLLGEGRLPGESAVLQDGKYEQGDVNMRLDPDSEPVYTDLNGDGIVDVAAILEQVGDPEKESSEKAGWKGVYSWTWDGSEATPVKWQAAWQYNCATVPAADGRESDYDLSLRLSPGKSVAHSSASATPDIFAM